MIQNGLKDELHTGSSVPSAAPSQAADTQPVLTLPSPPNFSTPVTSLLPSHFKSLSYDAAAWTWTSHELQEIVSRTIRHSARESFIRLLSLKLLDTVLPDELQKLNNQRQTSGKRYRDVVQRRNTLVQGLWNAIVNQTTGLPSIQNASFSISSACTLLSQLSEIFAECDKLAEGLVRICDQIKEIQELLDSHTASALAVALRKARQVLFRSKFQC
ncbi:hypothetical protein L218DRAFT_432401 [Marasmius fiardii PR-910]|nr:hypothetical protein L218DRAFT_432401 [Marasmius fiardii PR-910]